MLSDPSRGGSSADLEAGCDKLADFTCPFGRADVVSPVALLLELVLLRGLAGQKEERG